VNNNIDIIKLYIYIMCFNKEVSIITYIIGLAGCLNLYFNFNLKIEAIFFGWVIQMQLIEYVLWDNQPCNQTNINTTTIGTIVNHLEPIIFWGAILLLSTKQLPIYVNILMIIFTIVSIIYTSDVLKNECTTVTPISKTHLHWKWNEGSRFYYPFFLLCLNLLSIFGLEHGYHTAFIITILFAISGMIYNKKSSVGAMWCFFAAYTPWFLPYIYKIPLN